MHGVIGISKQITLFVANAVSTSNTTWYELTVDSGSVIHVLPYLEN
jgi:hypothetical protein